MREMTLREKDARATRKWERKRKKKKVFRYWKRRQRKKIKPHPAVARLIGKPYEVFLKSDYWKGIRNIILKRDKYKCTACGSNDNLQVHHATYKNHFNEHKHLEDLHALCDNCHNEIHRIKDIK